MGLGYTQKQNRKKNKFITKIHKIPVQCRVRHFYEHLHFKTASQQNFNFRLDAGDKTFCFIAVTTEKMVVTGLRLHYRPITPVSLQTIQHNIQILAGCFLKVITEPYLSTFLVYLSNILD